MPDMNQLNNEYLSSLIFRHRDNDGFPLYLGNFGYRKDNEPFQLVSTKAITIHDAVDRFLLHGLDIVGQTKNILLFLSQSPWLSRKTFSYVNSQLQFLLPQNIKICTIDLGDLKNTPATLLRTIMRQSGIKEVEKEDSTNVKKFEKFIRFQWEEYKRKYYYILFRSDNLSFSQLKSLRSLSINGSDNMPLTYFVMEGTVQTSNTIQDLRKDGISDLLYESFTILNRGSLDTVKKNTENKLEKTVNSIMDINVFRDCFYWVDGAPIYPLMHSVLYRISTRSTTWLDNQTWKIIAHEIQSENDEFIARAPEYKKKLEKKDYIFPPELLRDGPSITEARRFFKWIGWEE